MDKMLEMLLRSSGFDLEVIKPRIEQVLAMAMSWDERISLIDRKLNFIISEMQKPQVVTAVMHAEIPPTVNDKGNC
jgi:hypothetical protein